MIRYSGRDGTREADPYQPRKEFNEEHLRSLAESIRQYGILHRLPSRARSDEADAVSRRNMNSSQVSAGFALRAHRLRKCRSSSVREKKRAR